MSNAVKKGGEGVQSEDSIFFRRLVIWLYIAIAIVIFLYLSYICWILSIEVKDSNVGETGFRLPPFLWLHLSVTSIFVFIVLFFRKLVVLNTEKIVSPIDRGAMKDDKRSRRLSDARKEKEGEQNRLTNLVDQVGNDLIVDITKEKIINKLSSITEAS